MLIKTKLEPPALKSRMLFRKDLIEDHIFEFVEQYDPMTGLRWIVRLPGNILNQRSLLRLYQCLFLLCLTEFSDAKTILAKIEKDKNRSFEKYSGGKKTLCEDLTTFIKSILQIIYINEDSNLDQFNTLRNNISPANPLLSVALDIPIACILILKGDLDPAEASFVKLSELASSIDAVRQNVYLAKFKSIIARSRGQLHQAETILEQALLSLTRQGRKNISMAHLLYRHLGLVFYFQNKLEKAREYAAVASRYCEYSGLILEVLAGNELHFLLHLASGEHEQAAECIRQMRALAVKLSMPQIAAGADVSAANLAIEQGNLAAADLWLKHRKLQLNEPFSMLYAMKCLTQARLCYAGKQYPEAVHILKTTRDRCVKRNLLELVLQIDILRSANYYALNQREKAQSLLKKTLVFSESEGYIRPFVNTTKLIAPILVNIAETQPSSLLTSHFKSVLKACDIPFHRATTLKSCKTNGYGDLSTRELEILRWIADGYQNKEIAQKTFISVSTVKTHVHRILTKLGVSTRTQATVKAKELGLFKVI